MKHMDEHIMALKSQLNRGGPASTPPPKPLSYHEMTQSIAEGTLEMFQGRMDFETLEIAEYGISTRIPSGFVRMPEQYAKAKYLVETRPKYIYSDAVYDTSLGFNYTEQPVEEHQLEELKDAMKEMIRTMQPTANWMEHGIKFVHGKQVGYFTFSAPGIGGKLFTLMYFTSLKGKLLLCNFNCNDKERRIWMPIALGMMGNLQIMDQERGTNDGDQTDYI